MINSRLQFSWIPQSATHKICTKFSHLRTQFAFTKNSWASQLYWKLRCSSHPMRNKNWWKNIRKAKSREPIFTLPTHTTCFSLKHSFTCSQGCRAPTPHNHKLLPRRASLSSPATRPLLRVPRARSTLTLRLPDKPIHEKPSTERTTIKPARRPDPPAARCRGRKGTSMQQGTAADGIRHQTIPNPAWYETERWNAAC